MGIKKRVEESLHYRLKALKKWRRKSFPSQSEAVMDQWREDHGDSTLRLTYELNANSLVLDLGGFQGEWAAQIYERYACQIQIFEPVPEFYEFIQSRFSDNPKITSHCYGLGSKDETLEICISKDASSIYGTDGEKQKIQLTNVHKWFKNQIDKDVDLMKINIEGGEYDLLEHMHAMGDLLKVKHFQIQFHSWAPQAQKRYKVIHQYLKQTHQMTWCYPFVWENWSRVH